MAALDGERLDVGTEGLGYSSAVDGKQRDERVLARGGSPAATRRAPTFLHSSAIHR